MWGVVCGGVVFTGVPCGAVVYGAVVCGAVTYGAVVCGSLASWDVGQKGLLPPRATPPPQPLPNPGNKWGVFRCYVVSPWYVTPPPPPKGPPKVLPRPQMVWHNNIQSPLVCFALCSACFWSR